MSKVAVGNVKLERFVTKGFLRLYATQHGQLPLQFVDGARYIRTMQIRQ